MAALEKDIVPLRPTGTVIRLPFKTYCAIHGDTGKG